MKKRVEEWVNFAINDLNSAKKLSEDPNLNQNAAFHCQQALEKTLKAVIENYKSKTPRIHDLEKLYGMILESGYHITIDENILAEINDVYIETRYPPDLGLMPNGIPSEETIRKFIEEIETIIDQVMSNIDK